MSLAGFSQILGALKQRNFRIFMTGHLLSQVSMWMTRIVAGWLTWQLTESPTWLGLIGMADLAPTLFMGPLTGALADRFDKLTIVRLSQVGTTVFTLALTVLYYQGWLTIELLFVFMLVQGAFMAINLPARLAMIPNLIGKEKLQPAIAINALVSNGGRFLGPAVGGFVIVQWGIGPAWAVCALAYGLPALTLLLVRTSDETMKRSGKKLLGDAAEGITYAARHPGIGPLMAILIVTSTFGKPFGSLFPGFAADVFGRGADGLAWLTGAVGIGAVVGGIFMAQRTTGVTGLTRTCILQTGLIGTGLLLFMSTDIFWLAIPICIATGGASIINGVSAQTLLQHAGASNMRGRLASLFGMVMRGGQALGSLILGVTADLIGLRLTIALTGCICIGFWLWSLRRAKAMASTLEA